MSGSSDNKILKRSIQIAGHRTSVSIETPFWDLLKEIAHEERRSLSDLITEIDASRTTNLSSAIRLYVLQILQRQVAKKQST